jgi:hypothetical protein
VPEDIHDLADFSLSPDKSSRFEGLQIKGFQVEELSGLWISIEINLEPSIEEKSILLVCPDTPPYTVRFL